MSRSKSSLDSSPIHLLHRVGQLAADVFAEKVGSESVTPRQYAVLLTVAENEGLSQTGLVEKTGIDRSTLADIVRRMQTKNLLKRKRTKQDARTYAVSLTAKGTSVLKAAKPAASKADDNILGMLSARQREAFLDSLEKIVETTSETPPAKSRKRN